MDEYLFLAGVILALCLPPYWLYNKNEVCSKYYSKQGRVSCIFSSAPLPFDWELPHE